MHSEGPELPDDTTEAWRRTCVAERIVAEYHRAKEAEALTRQRVVVAWLVVAGGFVMFAFGATGFYDAPVLKGFLAFVGGCMIGAGLITIGAAQGERKVLRRWRCSLERAGLDLTPPKIVSKAPEGETRQHVPVVDDRDDE